MLKTIKKEVKKMNIVIHIVCVDWVPIVSYLNSHISIFDNDINRIANNEIVATVHTVSDCMTVCMTANLYTGTTCTILSAR